MNHIFFIVLLSFFAMSSCDDSLEDIANNLDKFYNVTINNTYQINLTKINSSATLTDISFIMRYDKRHLNETGNFIQYDNTHVILIYKLLIHKFSDKTNRTDFTISYLHGAFDINSIRLIGSDDGDFVLQTPLGFKNFTFYKGILSDYSYFNELFEDNNYLMVQAFGNIFLARLRNILANYPNSRPLVYMHYMKKHFNVYNVFYLIKSLEYGASKATITNFDFAEQIKLTYNSIKFISVSFILTYTQNEVEYEEQLGFKHIIINEQNLYYDKVSPFDFVSDVIVHEVLDRMFQNAKDNYNV